MSNTYTTKKALKIATALYMITDIMSEKEPLKWHLRNCAVALLEADIRNMRNTVERTLDILTISRIARAVSAMNANVLEDELRHLLNQTLADSDQKESVIPLFDKEFFNVQVELSAPKIDTTEEIKIVPQVQISSAPKEVKSETPVLKTILPIIKEEAKPRINLLDMDAEIEERKVERPNTTLIPQGIKSAFMGRVTLIDKDIIERGARSNDTKTNRRDVILNAIKEKDNCSIKDIASKLPSVSEKTIQRELVSMTEEGILLKEGDRRWSTYRIGVRHL